MGAGDANTRVVVPTTAYLPQIAIGVGIIAGSEFEDLRIKIGLGQ